MKPIPLQPNLPTPTNCFGKPVPASQWYVCPNCKKESPLTKEWVGLTDDELRHAYGEVSGNEWCLGGISNAETYYDIIEAKLKEKNS